MVTGVWSGDAVAFTRWINVITGAQTAYEIPTHRNIDKANLEWVKAAGYNIWVYESDRSSKLALWTAPETASPYRISRHGDILGGILDIAGGFTGVGGLVKHAAAYAAKKAAAKLFTKAKSFRGVANSGRWARKAARQGAKQVRAAARYSAREKRYTRYGIAATALYEGSAQVRSRYHF